MLPIDPSLIVDSAGGMISRAVHAPPNVCVYPRGDARWCLSGVCVGVRESSRRVWDLKGEKTLDCFPSTTGSYLKSPWK